MRATRKPGKPISGKIRIHLMVDPEVKKEADIQAHANARTLSAQINRTLREVWGMS